MNFAGFPPTTVHGSTSLNTAARAPTTAPSPTVTPIPTNASAAIHANELIVIIFFVPLGVTGALNERKNLYIK